MTVFITPCKGNDIVKSDDWVELALLQYVLSDFGSIDKYVNVSIEQKSDTVTLGEPTLMELSIDTQTKEFETSLYLGEYARVLNITIQKRQQSYSSLDRVKLDAEIHYLEKIIEIYTGYSVFLEDFNSKLSEAFSIKLLSIKHTFKYDDVTYKYNVLFDPKCKCVWKYYKLDN